MLKIIFSRSDLPSEREQGRVKKLSRHVCFHNCQNKGALAISQIQVFKKNLNEERKIMTK